MNSKANGLLNKVRQGEHKMKDAKKNTKKASKKPAEKKQIGSTIETQKAFAEALMNKGKSRKDVALALADKFGLAESSAMSYVYRWFVGKDYKIKKAGSEKKAPKASKAPAKKAVKKAPTKTEKKATAKKPVEKKPVAKKATAKTPSAGEKPAPAKAAAAATKKDDFEF